MSISPFDSPTLTGLVSDPALAQPLSEPAVIAAMIRVEAALARAEARVGVIPEAEGLALAEALENLVEAKAVTPGDLAEGAAGSAVSTPALVAKLRSLLSPELGQHLHWGATSQDIQDTGLILRIRQILPVIESRIGAAEQRLIALAQAHRRTPCVARTWGQQAVPTSFGLQCAVWLGPLPRLRQRLAEMAPRLMAVQFGGGVGNLSALGDKGVAVRDALAEELGLAPAAPWHAQRDRIGEFAAWCAGLAGAFGKVGADLSLLAMSEVAEVRLGASGGSSTMPQKQNPVGPQTLVMLARYAATETATVLQAAAHGQERDGAAWLSEWMSLPAVIAAAGGAARIGAETLAGLEPIEERMLANLEASGGAVLAEAASFELARHMPRADAQALVKAAARDGGPLLDALEKRTAAPVDWAALARWDQRLGSADALIDQALEEAGATA